MKTKCLLSVASLLLAPAAAWAQEETRVIIEEREPVTSLEVGLGVSDFTQGLDRATDPGAGWDVRAVFGVRSPVGLEVAYIGAMNDLDAVADEDARLLTTGGEAMIRASLPSPVRPFVAAGIGVHNHAVVTDIDEARAQFNDSTDIAVPAAAGIQIDLAPNVTLGGRFTYRWLFDDEVIADEDATVAQSWAATARLGALF